MSAEADTALRSIIGQTRHPIVRGDRFDRTYLSAQIDIIELFFEHDKELAKQATAAVKALQAKAA